MDESPVRLEPLAFCSVFIKEEFVEGEVLVKIERDSSVNEENSSTFADDPNISPDTGGTYTCEICTKEFHQKRYLTAHRHRHPEYEDLAVTLKKEKLKTKERQFTCLYCPKQYYNRSTVNRHMKIHTGEKPISKDFICDECHKAFADKSDLRVHLRVHTGEKPFKCETCDRRFSQRASLMYHEKGHSDKKPFPCDLCEKQFLRRISLERHKRIHSGDRPFKCQLCEKAFTQKRHLVVHGRIHMKKSKNEKQESN